MININTFFLDELLGNNYPVNVKSWKLPEYERKIVSDIENYAKKTGRFIISIEGLRNTGKTTVLKQLLAKLQKSGNNICYFSFERKSVQNIRNLEVVLDFFINENSQSCICLDEVCAIKGWSEVIRKYFENSKSSFLLSGTASLLDGNENDSLSKKIKKYKLYPAGFNEYLDIKKIKEKTYYISFPDPLCSNFFLDFLDGFMTKGSFPELYNIEDRMLINQYIKTSVLEKTVFEDIPAFFNIKHLEKLLDVYNFLAYHSGEFIYEKSFSDVINLSEPTINTFFSHLEDFHLFERVYTTSNINKTVRRKKKVFLSSASLYTNTTSNFSSGNLYLTAVYEKLRCFNPVIYLDHQIHEVDFILNIKDRLYPIIVKAIDVISASELNNLIYLMKKQKLSEGYLIYKGTYKVMEFSGYKIFLIPISTFLVSEISFA
jgi:predicted AAA+ superfamily ATPase